MCPLPNFAEKKTEMALLVCLMHYTFTDLHLRLSLGLARLKVIGSVSFCLLVTDGQCMHRSSADFARDSDMHISRALKMAPVFRFPQIVLLLAVDFAR